MAVEVKSEAKAETKKSNVATTLIHIGEVPNVKIFYKGQEVTGLSKSDMEYLQNNGFIKEA